MSRFSRNTAFSLLVLGLALAGVAGADDFVPGREVSIQRHLADGEEHQVSRLQLIAHGQDLFNAVWTGQEGGGRPLTTGTGNPLADSGSPLVFPRNFNRISAPDANSCGGCHAQPRSGGSGDIVANVFVLGQRFDDLTFDPTDTTPLRSSHDERGVFATLPEAANSRGTVGMFGSGYVEMLAREITADLRAIRDTLGAGESAALTSKGVSFGTLSRGGDGTWNTSLVSGLPAPSLSSAGPDSPPSLIIRPFHQAGAVVSLRQFTNNAFNHHHGIQTTERFGDGTDVDGDGWVDEMTRADVTAASVYQATLSVPGRVIPRYRPLEEAVLRGEEAFAEVGCDSCHMPRLPLQNSHYSEPNPYNPAGNLQVGESESYAVNLNSKILPAPRLRGRQGTTWVPLYSDLKLHDITSGPDDPNREFLDMQHPPGTASFFAGNGKFLTARLWGVANQPPFYHHGKYTTLREAIEAHAGEAQGSTDAFLALSAYDQGSIIEFLKTLQILPEKAKSLVIDEKGRPRSWPPPWAR